MPAAGLAALLFLAPALRAHGGSYRGPSSVVPPSSSSGSGSSASGSGNSGSGGSGGNVSGGTGTSASSGGPTTPGPTAGSASVPSAGRGAGGAPVGSDLGRWQYWWEFNKDGVLLLRSALQAQLGGLDDALLGHVRAAGFEERLPPSRKDIDDRIRPALLAVLASEHQRDMVSGAMVALAKISHGETEVRAQFVRRLCSKDQEIRETAALALGIAGNPDSLELLAALFADRDAGRAAVERAEVDVRTRAFSGYALGLIANTTNDPAVKLRVFAILEPALDPATPLDRNVRVAAVLAVRMLGLDRRDARQLKLRDEAVRVLLVYHRASLGPGEEWQQAHASIACSRLLGRGDSALHHDVQRALSAELQATKPRSEPILQSATLALGELSLPPEHGAEEAAVAELLKRVHQTARDWQVRMYALQALGDVGGEANRNWLLARLQDGHQLEQAWSAMALGFAAWNADKPDHEAGALLQSRLQQIKDPEPRAAMAVALGLVRHGSATSELRKLLKEYRHQDELCGYLCIALSLVGDRSVLPELQEVVTAALRRPELLRQAAVALGRFGDHHAKDQFLAVLVDPTATAARLAAVAPALSQIGDRRCIDPLLKILGDDQQLSLARAFAAVALGGMGDKSPLPWNAAIGRGLNYRAAVETLTSESAGVLDIF
jgi:HEAT repeat protein